MKNQKKSQALQLDFKEFFEEKSYISFSIINYIFCNLVVSFIILCFILENCTNVYLMVVFSL